MTYSSERNARRARRKYLTPLAQMPYSQCVMTITEMNPQRAEATLRAMLSCSRTNCWWAEYDLAQRFISTLNQKLSKHYAGHNA